MKSKDALVFVNYKYFRTSPENRQKYSRAYFYVSKKPRVLDLVGNGGRLWVATSSRLKGAERVYSLAYKLNQCRPFDVWPHLQNQFGNLGVTAEPDKCMHYPSNNFTDLLMNFEFVPLKPIKQRSSIGMSLMSARELSTHDISRLLEYEDKVLHGRHAFISYSSINTDVANNLQIQLEKHGHAVWRDIRSIIGGEKWESEIYRAIENADVFIVIISAHSAVSSWVQKEIKSALKIINKPGKLKRIIPLVIDDVSWSLFNNLDEYHKIIETGDNAGIIRVDEELRCLSL